MNAISVILSILVIISAVFMIVTIMLQDPSTKGMGALGGSSDTYFSRNKNQTKQAKLALMTKIAAGVFVVCSLIMVMLK